MKKKVYIFILAFLLILVSWIILKDKDKTRLLGKLSTPGISSVYFRVYQEDEFDSATGIYYEVVDKNDSVLSSIYHLSGTLDYHKDARHFFTGIQDSIIYLSFYDPNDVYAMFDLKTKTGFPKSITTSEGYKEKSERGKQLFKRLKFFNNKLKFDG